MKIVICDDDSGQSLITKEIVEEALGDTGDHTIELYEPKEIDSLIDEGEFKCGLLITDIQFTNCDFDGIKLAEKINSKMSDCKIIFVSNYLEYGPKVYTTEHIWFVWKQNMDTLLKRAICKAIAVEENSIANDIVEFFSDGKKTILREKDIIYIERQERHISIVTENRAYEACMSLTKLKSQMTENMARANGSCIVNLRYITGMNGKSIELESGKSFELGRNFEKDFKKIYLQYISKNL